MFIPTWLIFVALWFILGFIADAEDAVAESEYDSNLRNHYDDY